MIVFEAGNDTVLHPEATDCSSEGTDAKDKCIECSLCQKKTYYRYSYQAADWAQHKETCKSPYIPQSRFTSFSQTEEAWTADSNLSSEICPAVECIKISPSIDPDDLSWKPIYIPLSHAIFDSNREPLPISARLGFPLVVYWLPRNPDQKAKFCTWMSLLTMNPTTGVPTLEPRQEGLGSIYLARKDRWALPLETMWVILDRFLAIFQAFKRGDEPKRVAIWYEKEMLGEQIRFFTELANHLNKPPREVMINMHELRSVSLLWKALEKSKWERLLSA